MDQSGARSGARGQPWQSVQRPSSWEGWEQGTGPGLGRESGSSACNPGSALNHLCGRGQSLDLSGVFCGVFFFFFWLFRASPAAYGGSQARGLMGATAAGLYHSHGNARSELRLRPTPQLTATPDPQPTEQGQGSKPQPLGSHSDSFPLCHNGTSS